jgi:hypothetical protein
MINSRNLGQLRYRWYSYLASVSRQQELPGKAWQLSGGQFLTSQMAKRAHLATWPFSMWKIGQVAR